MQNVLSSLNNTLSHLFSSNFANFFAQASRFFLCSTVSSDFRPALHPLNPNSKHLLRTVDEATCTEHFSCHSLKSCDDVSLRLLIQVLFNTLSCLSADFLDRPDRCLSLVSPVSFFLLIILETVLRLQPTLAAI